MIHEWDLGFLQEDWNERRIAELNLLLKKDSPDKILEWTVDWLFPWVSMACSFGLEDVVLLHMVAQLEQKPKIFFIDTGRIHQETYELVDRIRQRYQLAIDVYSPDGKAVADMSSSFGYSHIYESHDHRKACCEVRKLVPLRQALEGSRGWVTGLRRQQNTTRQATEVLQIDYANGNILKINPLCNWTTEDVWAFVKKNNIPYNSLHDKGFPSIGCAPCTRAIQDGEDLRAGRWWWENSATRECGLHNGKRNRIEVNNG